MKFAKRSRIFLNRFLTEENIVLSRPERARLFEQIAAEILGLALFNLFLKTIRLLKLW